MLMRWIVSGEGEGVVKVEVEVVGSLVVVVEVVVFEVVSEEVVCGPRISRAIASIEASAMRG